MSQYDFGNLSSPLPGPQFFNSNLEPWRDALHSNHSGITRPSYVVAGMNWIDISDDPIWALKIFNGTDDIILSYLDTITLNVTAPYDNSGSTLAADTVQEAIDELDAEKFGVGDAATTSDIIAGTADKVVTAAAISPLYYGTKVRNSADQNTTSSLVLSWNNEVYDDNGWHDNTTNNQRITVDFTGRVQIKVSLNIGTSTPAVYTMQINKNGTAVGWVSSYTSAATAGIGLNFCDDFECVPGDYFTVTLIAGAGTVGASPASRFTATRIK